MSELSAEQAKWGRHLERTGWILVTFGMLSQVSTEYAFPSYNVALGFWAAYCVLGKTGKGTFCLLTFLFLGIILDIVFCSINSSPSSTFQFALVMLIFALFTKVYMLFCGAHFFGAIGGAYDMEQSMLAGSAYDSLQKASSEHEHAGYYPPSSNLDGSGHLNSSSGGGVGGAGRGVGVRGGGGELDEAGRF